MSDAIVCGDIVLQFNETLPHNSAFKMTILFVPPKGSLYLIIAILMIISWPLLSKKSEGRYPFEKSRSINVDRAAPLGHQRRSILTLVFTDDLTVHKHWD